MSWWQGGLGSRGGTIMAILVFSGIKEWERELAEENEVGPWVMGPPPISADLAGGVRGEGEIA
jgi:hypothetical protein